MTILVTGLATLLFARALFYTLTGQNTNLAEDAGPIFLGMSHHLPYLAAPVVVGLILILLVFGRERSGSG